MEEIWCISLKTPKLRGHSMHVIWKNSRMIIIGGIGHKEVSVLNTDTRSPEVTGT
jgi:hypothetical protein